MNAPSRGVTGGRGSSHSYVALLRGINLGRRQLRMDDLKRIAGELGLEDPRSYIASGNLLFGSALGEPALKTALEWAISKHMSAEVGVMIRTAEELADIAAANPFAAKSGSLVVAIFLDNEPPPHALEQSRNASGEQMALGKREIYVHYPDGQGRSRLKIPASALGTARNMNTVGRLAELAREKS